MIPLRDRLPSKRVPVMTVLLIIANVYVFVKELFLGPGAEAFIYRFGVVPAVYLAPAEEAAGFFWKNFTLVSALFLHGGWIHLIGNMWFLWIFGDNVEDAFGHVQFLFFYLVCGVAGNLAHIFMNAYSRVPAVGASGCIAGVLGAYYLLFPGARIVTLVPVLFFFTIVEIPAFFFLGFWFVLQALNGFLSVPGGKNSAGIAWWAHTGGFLAGMLLTLFMSFAAPAPRRKRR